MSDPKNYTVGWICAIKPEYVAARSFLDEEHKKPELLSINDNNHYTLGKIGEHNIAIATLPAGEYGISSATAVVKDMLHSFPNIRIGLMVGIGGGAPSAKHDIRLGDIVVSAPRHGNSGVFQYDFGETIQNQSFRPTGFQSQPPAFLRAALSGLEARYEADGHQLESAISEILAKKPRLQKNYRRPNPSSDVLYRSEIIHPPTEAGEGCATVCGKDSSKLVLRPERTEEEDNPAVHLGLIASANQLMKNANVRDSLAAEKDVLCFEMEAAGLMNQFPCLVIRGICDYSDSHKNKEWQGYAAMAAAAYAKDLLCEIVPSKVEAERKIAEIPGILSIQRNVIDIRNDVQETNNNLKAFVSEQRIKLNLPTATGAAFGSYDDRDEPECLEGTRVDLLNQIIQWADDPHGKSIFWLVGKAGTGKSTISRTVARKLSVKKQLAASFFFKRGEADRSNSARFFTTIADQLANYHRSLMSSIQQAIQADQKISRNVLTDQFEKLIFQPLSEVKPASRVSSIILLIDALDECDGTKDIKTIINLLARLKDVKPVDVRVFLTSRPDLPIRPTFRRLPQNTYEDIILHEVPKIERDISLFLQDELSKIRKNREELSLPKEWPGDENIKELIKRAIPLFIYAATLCRFIGDENWDPNEQIKIVLDYRTSWQESQLDMPYLLILNQLVVGQSADQEKRIVEEFRQIVGTIINLASPLSTSSLARLLSFSENTVSCRLRSLHSVLDVPDNYYTPIRTFHLSFRDFLLSPSLREQKSPFWIDEKEAHRMIASKCIELMSKGLRKNICNLKSFGTLRFDINRQLVETHLPSELQYACCYWIYHLEQSGDHLSDNSQSYEFLRKHLLHWLEAMSLLGSIAEAINATNILSSIVDTDKGKEFINDIKRFVLQNQSMIDKAPLQIYVSAIIFSPERSIVREKFNVEKFDWIFKLPKVQNNWDALLQTLEGHTDYVKAVAFSPDGKVLASASGDKTVRLWDVATGAALQTLEGHTSSVTAVAFSLDGKVLASASYDKTVRLWNAVTGVTLQTLQGHTDSVEAVAFSPDGKVLASAASYDNTIRLWDAATGAALQTLEGHTDYVTAIAFSPDGKVLASAGSYDNTIRLWDAATGVALQTLKGHTGRATAVAFSPDGKVLASASHDKTVRLWDAAAGAALQTLERHTYSVTAVAFSPDGKVLASAASYDKTVRLWDAATGAALQTLEGHTDYVTAIAFSPDGKVLASASGDNFRLWDAATGATLQTLEGHTGHVMAVAFSPDGKVLASASVDKTVRLWDAAAGAALQPLEGHTSYVTAVAFSPDSKVLASASVDKTVRLWDAAAGAALQMLEGHTDYVTAIAFSPDGKVLASASYDKTVRLWNAVTGVTLQTLEEHTYPVKAVAFSPDGKVLASASSDRDSAVSLWDAATGAALQTLQVHIDYVTAVAFSPGGKALASASGDRDSAVSLWDVATGAALQKLKGHTDFVTAVAFSPDGKVLASASGDKTVRLWDAATGAVLQKLKGHTGRVMAVAFSPDGKVLASASDDNTVRLWDAATGAALQKLKGHAGRAIVVAFSPDGKVLASASVDKTVRLWDAGTGATLQILSAGSAATYMSCQLDQHGAIDIKDEWVTRGGERLLWLPHNRRAAFVRDSGNIPFIEVHF